MSDVRDELELLQAILQHDYTLVDDLLEMRLDHGRLLQVRLGQYPISKPSVRYTGQVGNQEHEEVTKLVTRVLDEWTSPTPVLYTLYDEVSNKIRERTEAQDQEPSTLEIKEDPSNVVMKRILIWTHHLLALSKRKDIIQWSSELHLNGISKPGYPGIIIVEGDGLEVDEFITRIKGLNWQAITVRHEETDTLRRLDGFHEVSDMSDVSKRMEGAGLRDMFMTAMKIS